MFKFVHRLAGLALAIIIVGGSAVVVMHSIDTEYRWMQFAAQYSRDQYTACSIALGTVFLGLLFVATGGRGRRADRYLSFSNDEGKISVSVKGIASFISKLDSEFDAVSGLRAHIIPNDASIDVVLDARIRRGVQIHEVCHLLQRRVREALRESLGVTEVRHITVNVREIMPGRRGSVERDLEPTSS